MEPQEPTGRIPGRRAGDEGEVEVRDDQGEKEEEERPGVAAPGFHLFGVVRSGARWQVLRRRATDPDPLPRVRFRDLEAVVRRVSFDLPRLDKEALLAHQRVVDETMRREAILPAPFGVVFRGRRDVIRFMEEQYLVLDEALSLVDGHWELRLHLSFAEPEHGDVDLAASIYGELRRYARAALPFAPDGERVFSAAFLVERDAWVEFWERAEDVGADHPELLFDLTGPWPPYDFVRMVP
ncbi:MAG TPA: GvpL/GvpF family gas vesicle protein [Longimicrobiales bacterium]|nr:GvpL/GvpF family gas vesicle protein [Longimicrobiales bacterium]